MTANPAHGYPPHIPDEEEGRVVNRWFRERVVDLGVMDVPEGRSADLPEELRRAADARLRELEAALAFELPAIEDES